MTKLSAKSKDMSSDPIENLETIEECFIITPIGAPNSDIFIKAMGLIDAVIDPVLEEHGMSAMPANRMQDLGSINKQLIKRVIEDRLVIANLTGLNPNVMYELAIRHGARKPVIIMAEEGTRLPFDINDQRTIFYSDTLSGVEIAKNELRKKIEFALLDENPDNPIYSFLESAKLFKDIGEVDPNRALLQMVNDIKETLSKNDKYKSSISETAFIQRNIPNENVSSEGFSVIGKIRLEHGTEEFDKVCKEIWKLCEKLNINTTEIAISQNGNFVIKTRSSNFVLLNDFIKQLSNIKPISNINLT